MAPVVVTNIRWKQFKKKNRSGAACLASVELNEGGSFFE